MNTKTTLKTITIKDLWNVFRGCFLFVLAAAIVVTAFMYVRAKASYSPRYSSTATLYLVSENNDEFNQSEWAYDYNLAQVVLKDAIYLLTSRNVLDAVGEDIGISNGYNALRGSITITNPEDTRVLELTATASSPETAKAIVDGVCKHGPQATKDILEYDRMQIYQEGTLNRNPVNAVGGIMAYIIYGVIAGVFVYVIFLAMFLFDNYIHTEEDIDRYLGLTILGDIPDADAPKKKNKYSRYRYYRKSKYKTTYASPQIKTEGDNENGTDKA